MHVKNKPWDNAQNHTSSDMIDEINYGKVELPLRMKPNWSSTWSCAMEGRRMWWTNNFSGMRRESGGVMDMGLYWDNMELGFGDCGTGVTIAIRHWLGTQPVETETFSICVTISLLHKNSNHDKTTLAHYQLLKWILTVALSNNKGWQWV